MMKKKRLLFVITYLDCGGICRSLQNFLNKYDTSRYDIDVFAMVHCGMYCGEFRNCSILKANPIVEALISRYGSIRGSKKLLSVFLKLLRKVFGLSFRDRIFKIAGRKLIKSMQYDKIIAFSEDVPTRLVSFMKHPHKVAWIHCDYSNYIKGVSAKDEHAVYSQFESIVCVSAYTRDVFVSFYPDLKERITFAYNIMDTEMMKGMSGLPQDPSFDRNVFNIVSVGRIDPVKRFSIIPKIASSVIKNIDKEIRWYIIGPSGGQPDEYNKLINGIKEFELEETVILTGEQSNPYNFISRADLLVNTSMSEACPYVINEAKILGTPCICTDFGSAREFVENGKTGIITPIDEMPSTIVSVLSNPGLYNGIKANLENYMYDNASVLARYYSIL